jgi:hypothetical protein
MNNYKIIARDLQGNKRTRYFITYNQAMNYFNHSDIMTLGDHIVLIDRRTNEVLREWKSIYYK